MKILIIALLVSVSTHAELIPDSKLTKEVAQCNFKADVKGASSAQKIIFIKQWHLLPSVNTHDAMPTATAFPQAKNQIAIYHQLEEWIKQSKKPLVILIEGCEDDSKFASLKFNGWDLENLKKVKSQDAVLTHVGLKLKAKYDSKIKLACSDQDALIKESQLALSDARADLGYISRLQEYKNNPERVKIYLEGAIEGYQMQKNTTVEQAIVKVKEILKTDIEKSKLANENRSVHVVDVIQSAQKSNPESDLVVIWGGLHSKTVQNSLEKAKKSCSILEPVGYDPGDEKIYESLNKALK